ncbi:MAG: hypothetical protein CK425_09405 [Parachlamydia sp.]|nr:MAG: hypothetical protein CK425_09405 [Parachlamydia sp.]
MIDFIKITNNRAYAASMTEEFSKNLFEDADPSKKLLASMSYRIHQGFIGKLLAKMGFAIKIEVGSTDPKDPKIIYINKNSLINQISRFTHCAQKATDGPDWIKKVADFYANPAKLSADDKKDYQSLQKITRTELKKLAKKPIKEKLIKFNENLHTQISSEYDKLKA